MMTMAQKNLTNKLVASERHEAAEVWNLSRKLVGKPAAWHAAAVKAQAAARRAILAECGR